VKVPVADMAGDRGKYIFAVFLDDRVHLRQEMLEVFRFYDHVIDDRQGVLALHVLSQQVEAFAARDPKRTGVYSFEKQAQLDRKAEAKFRASKAAWKFFQAQPPGYRRLMAHWIMSAKREETRARRLDQLIATSAKQTRVTVLTGKPEALS
jgi:hypothetical protein